MPSKLWPFWRHLASIHRQGPSEFWIADMGSQNGQPHFRFILHHGAATFSGQLSGEVVIGPEVNFAFRMEKVAKDLGAQRLISAPAAERLPPPIATRPAGRCAVAGFSGHWDFHTFD